MKEEEQGGLESGRKRSRVLSEGRESSEVYREERMETDVKIGGTSYRYR